MSKQFNHLYEFGEFRLDAAERVLRHGEKPVPLTPKAFETLLVLVRRGGHLVEKDELMKQVWADTVVEEANLARNVWTLRKALGDDEREHRYIETVSKLGYRFVAPVTELNEAIDVLVRRQVRAHIVTEEEDSSDRSRSRIGAEPAARIADVGVHPRSSVEYLVNEIKRHKRRAIAALAASAVALAGITFGLYKLIDQNRSVSNPSAAFQKMKMTKLTSTGKVTHAAISPDGKYLVHVVEHAGQQSLWLRQVATTSDKEIVPPSDYEYGGLTFSHDGNYVYYTGGRKSQEYGELYRMSILGGAASKLIEDIDSPVTLSPDGKQLAFVRGYPGEDEFALIVANADGTGEQRLAVRKVRFFVTPGGPAWSPDGKRLAWVNDSDAGGLIVLVVSVEDGAQTFLTAQRWSQIGRLAWLSDGSGLIMTATEQGSASFCCGPSPARSAQQVWYLSYPGGEPRRITTDVSDYQDVNLTADSNVLVAVRSEQLSNIWTTTAGADENRAILVTRNNTDGLGGISWSPDGEVVYVSSMSGNEDIWIMDADGKNLRQLTVDARNNNHPAVSSDGRYVAFVSDRTGHEDVWRMEINGGNARQLTDNGGSRPNYSPDGRWVVYASGDAAGQSRISKLSVDGGNPIQLTNHTSGRPSISPDGKQIVCGYFDDSDEQNSRWKYAIIPFEGGEPVKMFEIPPTVPFSSRFIWSPDGTLTYIDQHNGVSNIWSQPVDGSPPKQLTNFKSGRIFEFAWSFDGKWLALARGTVSSDVVMIRDFG
jgi:Tol biopolymer transport system component/DNA-binding winged helix-turn-helix (wHTH) protein